VGFKYSVVCDTLKFLGYDVVEDPRWVLAVIKDAGYDGCDLPGDPERVNPRELRPIVEALGLEVPAVQGAWAYFHAGESRDMAGPDREARRNGIAHSKACIDLAVALRAQFFQVSAVQPAIPQVLFPDLPIRTLRQNLVESLKEVCGYAGERGITILLEPLNGFEGYPGVLTTVAEAIGLVNALGYDNVGIQPDIHHMNMVEGSIPGAFRAAGELVRHVHMNETNLYSLGTGLADFNTIIQALMEIGFEGYLSVYMPLVSQEVYQMAPVGYGRSSTARGSGGGTRPDLAAYLVEAIDYLKEIEEAVGRQRRLYDADSAYC
jgi:sugar phosphate isomerase/epimerase